MRPNRQAEHDATDYSRALPNSRLLRTRVVRCLEQPLVQSLPSMNRELGCHVALILKHWSGTGTTILGIYKPSCSRRNDICCGDMLDHVAELCSSSFVLMIISTTQRSRLTGL